MTKRSWSIDSLVLIFSFIIVAQLLSYAVPHGQFERAPMPDQPDRMTVRFADGTNKETSVAYPFGAPQFPMTSAAILRKFTENVSRAVTDESVRALVGWLETSNILSHLKSWR